MSDPQQAERAFSANFEGVSSRSAFKFDRFSALRCVRAEGWFAHPRPACYDARSNVKGSRFCIPATGFPYSFPK